MISLPKWIQKSFDESYCPHCEKCNSKIPLDRNGVYKIGLAEEISKKTKQARLVFFYEYKCNTCGRNSRFSGFGTNMYDFIKDMIDLSNSPVQNAINEHSKSDKQQEEKIEKTDGISDKEMESFKRIMDKTEYFEDFLDEIGMTREEREHLKNEDQ